MDTDNNEICFVCLSSTSNKNKRCEICKCYAHHVCWKDFINNSICDNNNEIDSYYDIHNVLTSNNINCPQCKTKININQRTTRSQTKQKRLKLAIKELQTKLYITNNQTNIDIKKKHITELMKYMVKHKKLILEYAIAEKVIKERLTYFYYVDNWKLANMFHLEMFNEQIRKRYSVHDTAPSLADTGDDNDEAISSGGVMFH